MIFYLKIVIILNFKLYKIKEKIIKIYKLFV